jgi:signal transduction histidine kinase
MTDRLLDERTQLVHVEKLASIGRLAAGVAHEIGNPLGAINGYTHILRRSLAGNTEALEAVYGLERESARVDRIVRGLLDYARKRPTTPTAIDVNDCVRSVVALLTDQGALRPLRVTMRLDPDGVMTVGERHEMEQVLVNLLLNAVDALGGQGRVEVRTRRTTIDTLHVPSPRREGDPPAVNHARQSNPRLRGWLAAGDRPKELVQLVIADSGPGIPAGEEERIFDPFYTTKEPGKGTGLGLAIVARIVDNQRGVVWVQRAREGGAAFMVLLPRHQASIIAPPGTLAAPPARAVAR